MLIPALKTRLKHSYSFTLFKSRGSQSIIVLQHLKKSMEP